jgi:hypothetical protein
VHPEVVGGIPAEGHLAVRRPVAAFRRDDKSASSSRLARHQRLFRQWRLDRLRELDVLWRLNRLQRLCCHRFRERPGGVVLSGKISPREQAHKGQGDENTVMASVYNS